MKKMNGHNPTIDAEEPAVVPAKPALGKAALPPVDKRLLLPVPPKDAPHPPLRAAKGDDDLMSEEPSVPERG
jgi:hypothetical protein